MGFGQCYDSPTPSYALCNRARANLRMKVGNMVWTTPVFEEVVLCCEINSYVSAQL